MFGPNSLRWLLWTTYITATIAFTIQTASTNILKPVAIPVPDLDPAETLHFRRVGKLERTQVTAHIVVEEDLGAAYFSCARAKLAIAAYGLKDYRLKPYDDRAAVAMRALQASTLPIATTNWYNDASRHASEHPSVASYSSFLDRHFANQTHPLEYTAKVEEAALTDKNKGTLPTRPPLLFRQKRQLAGALFGLASLGFAAYNRYDIILLQKEAAKAREERQLLATGISSLASQSHRIATALNEEITRSTRLLTYAQQEIILEGLVSKVEQLSNHLVRLSRAVANGQLNADALLPSEATAALDQITAMAKTEDLRLATANINEILQGGAAATLDHGRKFLLSVITVPLSPNVPPQELWEFTQLPFHTPAGWFSIDMPRTFVTKSQSSSSDEFHTFSEGQINKCRPLRAALLCPPNPVSFFAKNPPDHKDEDSCLNAILRDRQQEIEQTCELVPVTKEEKVVALNDTAFAFFAKKETTLTVDCIGPGAIPRRHSFQGLAIINLPRRCSAYTPSRKVRPSYTLLNVTVHSHDFSIGVPEAIRQLSALAHVSEQYLARQNNTIASILNHTAHIAHIYDPTNPDSPFHGNLLGPHPSHFSTILLCLGVVVLAGIILWAIRKCRKDKKAADGARNHQPLTVTFNNTPNPNTTIATPPSTDTASSRPSTPDTVETAASEAPSAAPRTRNNTHDHGADETRRKRTLLDPSNSDPAVFYHNYIPPERSLPGTNPPLPPRNNPTH